MDESIYSEESNEEFIDEDDEEYNSEDSDNEVALSLLYFYDFTTFFLRLCVYIFIVEI